VDLITNAICVSEGKQTPVVNNTSSDDGDGHGSPGTDKSSFTTTWANHIVIIAVLVVLLVAAAVVVAIAN
jgi:hypothetical protein